MYSLVIFAQSGTLDAIRQSLPNDPVSLFVLALIVVATVAVFVGGRNKPGKGSGPGEVS